MQSKAYCHRAPAAAAAAADALQLAGHVMSKMNFAVLILDTTRVHYSSLLKCAIYFCKLFLPYL